MEAAKAGDTGRAFRRLVKEGRRAPALFEFETRHFETVTCLCVCADCVALVCDDGDGHTYPVMASMIGSVCPVSRWLEFTGCFLLVLAGSVARNY